MSREKKRRVKATEKDEKEGSKWEDAVRARRDEPEWTYV